MLNCTAFRSSFNRVILMNEESPAESRKLKESEESQFRQQEVSMIPSCYASCILRG
jgi:hypothetical protein